MVERRNPTPAEQILERGVIRLERKPRIFRNRNREVLRGKAYLFDHNLATYDLATGAIRIRKSGSGKEIDSKGRLIVPFDWPETMDIETAIAYTLDIADQYELDGGEETEKDRRILKTALETLGWWSELPSEVERQKKEQEIGRVLEEAKYRNVRDPHRKRASEKLRAGVQLDSTGKRNPQAKSTQIAVTVTEAEYRGKINRRVFEKYGVKLFSDLVSERAIERGKLLEAVDAIKNVEVYRRLNERFRREVLNLIQNLPSLLGHGVIKVAPYRREAQEVLAYLVRDLYSSSERIMSLALGNELFSEYKEAHTLKDFLQTLSNFPEYSKRSIILHLRRASSQLKAVLKEGERKMKEEEKKRRERLA